MSIATKQPQSAQHSTLRRIWKAPSSKAWWLWLGSSLLLCVGIALWFFLARRTQQDVGPYADPFRLFGIIAFGLVLATAAYSLRRRFIRGLPGKVQNWLWMHSWIGLATILIAAFHENFAYLTHDFCQGPGCLTDSDWGGTALFALILLVISGIVGRLLDMWQAHRIALDASTNGIGIAGALEERMTELEYTIERLCAGKSEGFKEYCLRALAPDKRAKSISTEIPMLAAGEKADFKSAYEALIARAQLAQSLQRQHRARAIIRIWRTLHMIVACVTLLAVLYHGILELLTSVFHIISYS
ncbi:hypothetical protein EPA93_30100 [Ktedonosporobacter rubrisoli]|uniref:Uncharacterized protein n=1 Tax=Ktedonosporobacter rubrisoli TaxID=2509675 RepID=A0A4P6JWD7_KTERU|nr:hypothetical protein [Ktedonosporobacter rubrisoli]QBD80007.1 hypothetical protein EPA93_30100 [Ktedonosporobacter rubrisoli]